MQTLEEKLDESLATARELGFCRGLFHAASVAEAHGAHALATVILRQVKGDTRTLANKSTTEAA